MISIKKTGQIHLPKRDVGLHAGLDLDFTGKAATAQKEAAPVGAVAWVKSVGYFTPKRRTFIMRISAPELPSA